jgi:hypothetical protein
MKGICMTKETHASKTVWDYLSQWLNQPGSFADKLGNKIGLSEKAIQMVLRREMQFPTQKLPELGGAIGVPPRELLRAALTEMHPELMKMIDEHLLPTPTEQRLLQVVEKYSDGKFSGPLVIEGRTVIALIAS